MKTPRLSYYEFFYCFLLYGFIQTGATFAEANSQNLIENRLSSILDQKTESIDLTETLLLISKDWNPPLKEKPLRSEIDQLVTSVKNQLRPESTPLETVDILRRVIHHEKKYRMRRLEIYLQERTSLSRMGSRNVMRISLKEECLCTHLSYY